MISDAEEAMTRFRGKPWDVEGWISAYNESTTSSERYMVVVAAYTDLLLQQTKCLKKTSWSQIYRSPQQQQQQQAHIKQIQWNVRQDRQELVEVLAPEELCKGTPERYTEIPDCSLMRRAYRSTQVLVVEGDTLDVTQVVRQQWAGKRVAVLNMTNPKRPGGGWLKGMIGQEESLFLRTALSQVLDPSYYQLEDLTAIYARDVAVLRGAFSDGFPFLGAGDVWRVDFVSVAGVDLYNKSLDTVEPFTEQTAVVVRGKAEAILAACAKNGADVLVLGALGCGAFENPLEEVAQVFDAVILQYAGFFQSIVFAIYSEKDAATFRRVFQSKNYSSQDLDLPNGSHATAAIVDAPCAYAATTATSNNEWKMPPPLPAAAFALDGRCVAYGTCTNPDPEHYSKKAHPPLCPLGRRCKDDTPRHRFLFLHIEKCPKWGFCDILFSKDEATVRAHLAHFDHPSVQQSHQYQQLPPTVLAILPPATQPLLAGLSFCPNVGLCEDDTPQHTDSFIHPPVCSDGLLCEHAGDSAHSAAFRHLREECTDDTHCMRCFTDPQHWELAKHSFVEPCPLAPYPCGDTSKEHLRRYSHMCPRGPYCEDTSPGHLRRYFHGSFTAKCPAGTECKDMSEEHLGAFFHPAGGDGGVQVQSPYLRQQCPDGIRCTDSSVAHLRGYAHTAAGLEHARVCSHNMRDPQVDGSNYGEWNQRDYPVNFSSNISGWLAHFGKKAAYTFDPKGANLAAVTAWVRGLRPVHMLGAGTLRSVAEFGCLSSLERLRSMWSSKDAITASILARDAVVAALDKAVAAIIAKVCGGSSNGNGNDNDNDSVAPTPGTIISDMRKTVEKYIKLYVRMTQSDIAKENSKKYLEGLSAAKAMPVPADWDAKKKDDHASRIARLELITKLYESTKPLLPMKMTSLAQLKEVIRMTYGCGGDDDDGLSVELLEREARATVDALHRLLDPENKNGVGSGGFFRDKEVRTNYTVFAVVGPHMDSYGDADAVLIFDQAIMFHPDYYMLPNAATLYSFGQYHNAKYETGLEMDRTPWMGKNPHNKNFTAGGDGRDAFRTQKFHPIDPRWAEAAAKEFMCRTRDFLSKSKGNNNDAAGAGGGGAAASSPAPITVNDVNLADVIAYWEKCNSHCVIEGHLPDTVPLSYVEHAVLKRSTYNALKDTPTGKRLLARWEARPGMLEIIGTNKKEDVNAANRDYFNSPPPALHGPHGFTFVLAGQRAKDVFVPLELPREHPSVTVRFAAKGLPFIVSLSNVGDITCKYSSTAAAAAARKGISPEANRRCAISFSLDAAGQLLTVHYVCPGACFSSNAKHRHTAFNARAAAPRDFVHYELFLDYRTQTITFRHWGPSAMYNAAALSVPMAQDVLAEEPDFARYSYVSFTNNSTSSIFPVTVADLAVVFD